MKYWNYLLTKFFKDFITVLLHSTRSDFPRETGNKIVSLRIYYSYVQKFNHKVYQAMLIFSQSFSSIFSSEGVEAACSLKERFLSNDEMLSSQVTHIRKDVNMYKKKQLESADGEKFVFNLVALNVNFHENISVKVGWIET